MTEYATRAWFSDSHSDFFTRNILAFSPGLGSEDEARARAMFTPNVAAVTWPTLDEVKRWDQAGSSPVAVGGAGPAVEILDLCRTVAIERIAERIGVHPRPVDVDGVYDPAGDPVEIRPSVKLAVIMQAVRWAGRAFTPSGVAGASELAGVIRVSAMDPDIESMIGNQVRWGIA